MMIRVDNDGPLVTATNYFDSEPAQLGLIYCAINAGAFRLLVPAEDDGRTDLRCIGYGPAMDILWDLPARFRRRPRVPYLKAWEK